MPLIRLRTPRSPRIRLAKTSRNRTFCPDGAEGSGGRAGDSVRSLKALGKVKNRYREHCSCSFVAIGGRRDGARQSPVTLAPQVPRHTAWLPRSCSPGEALATWLGKHVVRAGDPFRPTTDTSHGLVYGVLPTATWAARRGAGPAGTGRGRRPGLPLAPARPPGMVRSR